MRWPFALLVLLVACAEPTAIRVAAYSEIPCDTHADLSFSVAADAPSLANALTSATATECSDNGDGTVRRGSVVLSPHGDKEKAVAFQLTTRSDDQPLTACATDFQKCVVARRQLRFQSGSTVNVRVDLRRSCLGVVCSADQTCVKGQCVTAVLPPCGDCGEPLVGDQVKAQALNLCGDPSGTLAASPWPLAHGCPTNSGRTKVDPPASGATLIAPFSTGNVNQRAATIGGDGTIFIEDSTQGDVYAFDGATGSQKWKTPAGGSGFLPAVSIDKDNNLYNSTNYGMFWSLVPATGAVRWKQQVSGVLSPMTIAGPGVGFMGSLSYGFYAVTIPDGKQKWHTDTGDADTSQPPAVNAGIVYALDKKNAQLYAFAAEDGTQKFKVAIGGEPVGSPVIGVDAVYAATKTAGLAAFDLQTGAEKWRTPAGPTLQPALLANGNLASATGDGQAFTVDRTTGAVTNTLALGAPITQRPIAFADDTIVYSTSKATIAVKGNEQRWTSDLNGSIAPADHRVIVMPGTGGTFAVIGP